MGAIESGLLRIWARLFGPEHCMTCGDEFIEATYRDGYRRDGSLIVRTWKKCPRSDDLRWEPWDRYQIGRCSGPGPHACAVQEEAYRNHKPPHRACSHHSVSEKGDSCRAKDGRQITRDHRLIKETGNRAAAAQRAAPPVLTKRQVSQRERRRREGLLRAAALSGNPETESER